MQIRIGKADIVSMKPGVARSQAKKGSVGKRVIDRRADNTKTIGRNAAANLVKDNAGNGAGIRGPETFL